MKTKLILSALLAAGLTACGNAKQQDSAPDTTAAIEVTDTQTEEYALTDNGVGPIVLGMNVADIPSSVPGLYDRVEKVTTPGGEEYHFYEAETALFSAEDPDEGVICGISLFNESPIPCKTADGETYISK